jgi:hypothetical protein
MNELPIIQKTYDMIQWYVPHINKLPRDFKFSLGDRILQGLYSFLEELIRIRFMKDKRERLQRLNIDLDVLRYQTRLLHSFKLMQTKQYEHINQLFYGIGNDLGAWIKQQGPKIEL